MTKLPRSIKYALSLWCPSSYVSSEPIEIQNIDVTYTSISLPCGNLLGRLISTNASFGASVANFGRCKGVDSDREARRCVSLRHEMLNADSPAKLRLDGEGRR